MDSLSGTWWLPGEEDFEAPGTLEIGDDFRLTLLDRVGSQRLPTSRRDDRTIPVICGRCLGKQVMLLDCQVRGWTEMLTGSEVRPVLSAAHVLVSKGHTDFGHEVSFNQAELRLTHLNEWANRRPYGESRQDGVETVTLKKVEPLVVELADATMTLWRSTTMHHGFLDSLTWDSAEQVHLEFRERQSVDAILDTYVRPLRYLLTFAAGDLSALTYMNVSLVRPSQELFEGASYDVAIRPTQTRSRRVDPTEFRFTLDDNPYNATVDFARVVQDWFSLESEISFVSDLLFSLYESRAGYLESLMFNAASAAEGLHRTMVTSEAVKKAHRRLVAELAASVPNSYRKWLEEKLMFSYEPTFPERLHELIDYAGPSVEACIGNRKEWVRRVAAARNGLAHPDAKSRRNPVKLVRLMQTTRMLVEIALLRELGFSEEDCMKMAHQDPHWRHLAMEMPRMFPELFK